MPACSGTGAWRGRVLRGFLRRLLPAAGGEPLRGIDGVRGASPADTGFRELLWSPGAEPLITLSSHLSTAIVRPRCKSSSRNPSTPAPCLFHRGLATDVKLCSAAQTSVRLRISLCVCVMGQVPAAQEAQEVLLDTDPDAAHTDIDQGLTTSMFFTATSTPPQVRRRFKKAYAVRQLV